MCRTDGGKYLAPVQRCMTTGEWRSQEGTLYSVPRNESHNRRVCTAVRMYRSAQRKLISFTAPPCVSPASNFTVRMGPTEASVSTKNPGPPNIETFLVDTPPFSRAFAAAVINRVRPPHVSAMYRHVLSDPSGILVLWPEEISLAIPGKGVLEVMRVLHREIHLLL